MNVNELKRDYRLKDQDITCIALYKFTGLKLLAWSLSVGNKSKSANKNVIASKYFNQPNILKLLFDLNETEKKQRDIERIKESKDVKTFDATTKNVATSNPNVTYVTNDKNDIRSDSQHEITSENIKQKLEHELLHVQDPKDRAMILIKIADFVGLNNTSIDLTTPTIYLPARCSDCTLKR